MLYKSEGVYIHVDVNQIYQQTKYFEVEFRILCKKECKYIFKKFKITCKLYWKQVKYCKQGFEGIIVEIVP
jgi:hypothetical protein